MKNHIFIGFGFGPIQAGLFVNEAYKSGNFSRIVISEVDQKLVDAVRANNGCYYINVATFEGIEAFKIEGVEIYNPSNAKDRKEIIKALSQSTEICTSLPSVNFYDKGVAQLIKEGLSQTNNVLVYTAENNNHAAEILEQKIGSFKNVQFLNTVIGKMSQVVVNKEEITTKNLKSIATGFDRAFLVEEFNKILVTKCHLADFKPGIEVFIEKEDLLPFEEAKLYGHNAIHALLAYLGTQKGYKKMAELKNDKEIMQIAMDAFIKESGAALIKKYAHLNEELFTEKGFSAYAEDLLKRMTNAYLDDTIERAARDPERKLGINDRIFGTMQLALEQGIVPINMTKGAVAGVFYFAEQEKLNIQKDFKNILVKLWQNGDSKYKSKLIEFTERELTH
ncbi:MAG: hypothetical protein A2Y10_15985 [Planctomycetes bacterium GWF2_41_51]|nr:MAG: hypothetical protein A2Y10_15985 [Planctomycetes bacterium GWF2_41_51]HBG25637.1 hypothetical protein [Phycisphaerales bacterium]